MKLSRTELEALTGAKLPVSAVVPAESSEKSSSRVSTEESTAPEVPSNTSVAASPLESVAVRLKFATKAIWNKADRKTLTRKEQRDLLRQKLTWLAEKNGWIPLANKPIKYPESTRMVKGRGWLAVEAYSGSIHLELTHDLTASQARKLLAAKSSGVLPLLFLISDMPLKEELQRFEHKTGLKLNGVQITLLPT